MDPSQSNPEGQSNRIDVAMGSQESQQDPNAEQHDQMPPAQQQQSIMNPFLNNSQINSQSVPNCFQPRLTFAQQLENIQSRRIQNHQAQLNPNPIQQNQIHGNNNNQLIQPSTSKKRNFQKLLEQQAQLPQELYFPNQQETELQNQFKKLKLSHNVEVKELVANAERDAEAAQSLVGQSVLSQAHPVNNLQLNGSQFINPFYVHASEQSAQDPIAEKVPEELSQQSLNFSDMGQLRRSSKRLESRASRGLYLAGADESGAEGQYNLIDDLYHSELQHAANQNFQSNQLRLQSQENIEPGPRKIKLTQQQSRAQYHSKMQGSTTYNILLEQDPGVANLSIKDLQKLLKQRSSVHFAMKVRIIELRFGKYGQLEPARMSITNIAKKVSIARSTVHKIIQHYKINDGVIPGIPEKQQRKKILTEEIAAVLKDPKLLREWAHLSLDARCSILKEQYNVQMSRYTLANYYKQLKVGYLKTHSSFYSARSEEETARLRVEYIKKIIGHMKRDREIIYMDETTTDMWAIRGKIWQPKDSVLPLVIQRALKKESNVTIIGAISQKMKILFHHVTYSTNKETVENFYKKFHRKFNLDEKVIVMDNHRAHGANIVREFLEEQGAIIEFLPPCSSYFNPIETVWSWVKAKWKNSLLQAKDLKEDHHDWIRGELSRICQSCPEQVLHNIVKSCSRLMHKYLKQYSPNCQEIEFLESLEAKEQVAENQRAQLQQIQELDQIQS